MSAVSDRRARARHLRDLTVHLTVRELKLNYRHTLLGWTWPLVRQLLQLAVLVVAFSKVLDLGVQDYLVFVFSGIIAWTWFSQGIGSASRAVLGTRELALRPGFPVVVLPLIAVAVPLADAALAFPLLLLALVVEGDVHVELVLLPAIVLIQLALMVGIATLVASLSVFLRDIPNVVNVVILLGFYLTPVYFDQGRVPEQYRWLLRLNPMTIVLELDRAVMLGRPWPPTLAVVGLLVVVAVLLVGGLVVFRRLTPLFADEL